MDFLAKELVNTFVYTDFGKDREYATEVTINGRTYIKTGTYTATRVVADLYKLCTPSDNILKYVALVGISRQHPNDTKIKKEQGIEKAHENAMISPIATIKFDHKVSWYEIKPILEGILYSQNKSFIKTKQEIIASGKAKELAEQKYTR
ncbi:MAG: hypothetical protein J6D03_01175 [Clostridia bacterium]|nr:hypothetical protein [Clostridia bacterium]